MTDRLASEATTPQTVRIDATDLMAHRTADSLQLERESDDRRGHLIGRTKGGMNTKPHAIADAKVRQIHVIMT